MSTTLTNGLKLPDKGSVDWYADMQNNYTILDGAVGTIAEHTTALAGKAPLVHTHTKSDVTDLLNSNFIPSANNSYDLGSSSYQWNNLYAKNYYYNGVAWGLDKANVWSANNKFTDNVSIEKNTASPTASSDTSLALTGNSQYIFFRTKGSSNYKSYNSFLWGGYLNGVNPYRYGRIRLYRASAIYGETGEETPDTSFSFIDVALHYKWVSLTDNVRFINDGTTNACEPLTNNATDLGTSTNKWKTINGINPGALSLPDYDSAAKLNLTSTFPTPDYNGNIYYTPTMNGWLYICFNISSATTIVASDSIFYIQAKDNNVANANFVQTSWMLKSGGTNSLAIFFPVVANKQFVIQINFTGYTLTKVFLIPGLGHVA